MSARQKMIWVSWEMHRRTEGIVKALGIPLFVFQSNKSRWVKHPCFLSKTWGLIKRIRPQLIFVQNPSIFLTLFCLFVKRVYRFSLVVDAHNVGLWPFDKRYEKFGFLYKFMQRKADLTIVTNEGLADFVIKNGGRPFVLPDRLPEFERASNVVLKGERNITFICTFSDDEPFEEVLEAAGRLRNSAVHVYVTGNSRKGNRKRSFRQNSNVTFTGFLPDQEYINLLCSSDFILDLTFLEDCLVCGAYEGVSLGIPLILSETRALRKYFYKGCVFCKNDTESIVEAIGYALCEEDRLRAEVASLREELLSDWALRKDRMLSQLENIRHL